MFLPALNSSPKLPSGLPETWQVFTLLNRHGAALNNMRPQDSDDRGDSEMSTRTLSNSVYPCLSLSSWTLPSCCFDQKSWNKKLCISCLMLPHIMEEYVFSENLYSHINDISMSTTNLTVCACMCACVRVCVVGKRMGKTNQSICLRILVFSKNDVLC